MMTGEYFLTKEAKYEKVQQKKREVKESKK